MLSVSTFMDYVTAQKLLADLLCHVPRGWWWLLHPRNGPDLCIGNAFGIALADIDALLVIV